MCDPHKAEQGAPPAEAEALMTPERWALLAPFPTRWGTQLDKRGDLYNGQPRMDCVSLEVVDARALDNAERRYRELAEAAEPHRRGILGAGELDAVLRRHKEESP